MITVFEFIVKPLALFDRTYCTIICSAAVITTFECAIVSFDAVTIGMPGNSQLFNHEIENIVIQLAIQGINLGG